MLRISVMELQCTASTRTAVVELYIHHVLQARQRRTLILDELPLRAGPKNPETNERMKFLDNHTQYTCKHKATTTTIRVRYGSKYK